MIYRVPRELKHAPTEVTTTAHPLELPGHRTGLELELEVEALPLRCRQPHRHKYPCALVLGLEYVSVFFVLMGTTRADVVFSSGSW
jgi:hypothetical protein